MRNLKLFLLLVAVVFCVPALADPPYTTVDCGVYDIYLTTGGQQSYLLQYADGTYSLSDTHGNQTTAHCDKGCLTTTNRGGCHIGDTPVPAAKVDVQCGGTRHEITTGNEAGACNVSYDQGGDATGATCDDGEGNAATVDCSVNEGEGGCTSTTGAGDCDEDE